MNLSRLTNEELLRMLDGSKYLLSPVIDTLYLRLLTFVDKQPRDGANDLSECPICEVGLHIDYDHINEIYNLKYHSRE
jgi:hypothetical protein